MDDHCGTVTPVVSLPHERVLVEFPGTRDRKQLVRHLVGQQTHLGQGPVDIPSSWILCCELLFGVETGRTCSVSAAARL
jgi:hypothetical protein